MLNSILQKSSSDVSSSIAMILFAIIVFLIIFLVSKNKDKRVSKQNPYKNKLYSVYKSEKDEYILINHSTDDMKMTFDSMDELIKYMKLNDIK